MMWVVMLLLLSTSPVFAAITATNLTTDGANSPTATKATASISPSANKLILACVHSTVASGTPNIPTLTGNGMTWVQVSTRDEGVSRHTVFRAMDAAPSTGAVSIAFGQTPSAASWSIFELGNVDLGGTNGSIASVQSSAASCSNCGSVSSLLGNFFGVENATVGCGGAAANVNLIPKTGFTQIGQNAAGTSTRVLSQFNAGNDANVSFTSVSSATLIGIGLEICAGPTTNTRKEDGMILSLLRKALTPVLAWAAACPENDAPANLPVFPGAVGFGTETIAGRGGTVYKVTNLLSTNVAGSLANCVKATHPRVCIFETSGVIPSNNLTITSPFITIAGQTAPNPGIAITGTFNIETHDVLIQHLQFRQLNDAGAGAVSIGPDPNPVYNVVMDHVSSSWGSDTNFSIFEYNANYKSTSDLHDITVSNSIIAEGLEDSVHDEGTGYQLHSAGLMIGASPGKVVSPTNVSILNNLFAHNVTFRNPIASGTGTIANNVIYNYGGQAITFRNTHTELTQYSVVGNKTVKGVNWLANGNPMVLFNPQLDNAGSKFYLFDNRAEGFNNYGPAYATDPWSFAKNTSTGLSTASLTSATALAWPPGFTAMPGDQTEGYVKAHAGSRPKDDTTRNATDKRILLELTNRNGTQKDCVSTCDEPGTDVPAVWEGVAVTTRTLGGFSASPNQDSDGDGYTDIEELLHFYARAVEDPLAEVRVEPTNEELQSIPYGVTP